jgi:hypothetical protein
MPSSVATNGNLIPKPISGPHIVYGFLTTEPNDVVAPDPSEGDAGDPDDGLQRPLQGDGLMIAAREPEKEAIQGNIPSANRNSIIRLKVAR